MKLEQKKKLILIKPNGNHSNRLIQNLHFEVFCKEHGIEYQNPTFNDIAKYYNKPCNSKSSSFLKLLQINLLGKIFRHSRVVKKIFSVVWIISKISGLKFIRFDEDEEPSECAAKLLKGFEHHNKIYVGGWRFRLPELEKKYKNEMSENYSLKPQISNNNAFIEKINRLKSDNHILIGVHIRRGDYKHWKNGQFYYEDDVYKKQMDLISDKLSKAGKDKQTFILFSNEALNIHASETVLLSHEKWYVDHHCMSLCNYLIGPPSTFTLWASYLGKTELKYIQNKDENIADKLNINLLTSQ